MCGFSCCRCLFRIRHQVISLVIHAVESFLGKSSTPLLQEIFIVNVWAFYSIVYDNEFSARLSVGSIMRLRASALMALSNDTKADSASIFRLARQFLYTCKDEVDKLKENDSSEYLSTTSSGKDNQGSVRTAYYVF